MMSNKTILFTTLIAFLVMAISGLVMFFMFQESSLNYFLGMKKAGWMNVHNIAGVFTVILIAYHVAMRWGWIENIILRKKKIKLSKEMIGRRRNNTWFLLFFSLSFSTGFLSWIMGSDCEYCLEIHDKLGVVLVLIFLVHFYKHRSSFSRKKK